MVDMLGFISDQLDQLGIPYEFGEWTGEISYSSYSHACGRACGCTDHIMEYQ